MTDLATAMQAAEPIEVYHGRPVLRREIRIKNVGSGLDDPIKYKVPLGTNARTRFEPGEEVTLALRCTVSEDSFPFIPGTDAHVLVQSLKAGTVTVIPDSVVAEYLDAQDAAVARAKAEAKGSPQLPEVDGLPVGETRWVAHNTAQRTQLIHHAAGLHDEDDAGESRADPKQCPACAYFEQHPDELEADVEARQAEADERASRSHLALVPDSAEDEASEF